MMVPPFLMFFPAPVCLIRRNPMIKFKHSGVMTALLRLGRSDSSKNCFIYVVYARFWLGSAVDETDFHCAVNAINPLLALTKI